MLLFFQPLFGLLMTSEVEKRKSENKTKWAEEHFYKVLAADFDPLELDVCRISAWLLATAPANSDTWFVTATSGGMLGQNVSETNFISLKMIDSYFFCLH